MKMEAMKFDEQGPKISAIEIKKAEQQMGVAFPADYKAFLLRFNGGWSDICMCDKPFFATQSWLSVCDQVKLPIKSLQLAHENIKSYTQGKFFCIGSDMGERMVLMKAGMPGQFGIHLWEHEERFNPQSKPLFKSFTAMIEQFRQVDLEEYERILDAK